MIPDLGPILAGLTWHDGIPDITGLRHDELCTPTGEPYMRRYYLTHNRFRSTRIHHILLSDADPDMHDHPWDYTTELLHGSYLEHTPTGTTRYQAGDRLHRKAEQPHRLELTEPCWTLFATGRVRRKWGFHTDTGWQYWRTYRTNPSRAW